VQVLRFYFLDDETEGGNAVKDLLIPGFSEYMSAFHTELYDHFLLNLSAPYGGSGAQFNESFSRFAARLTERYDAITTKYGKLQQTERWRKALNMPSLSAAQLCAWEDSSALSPSESADCDTIDIRPCTETGCGRFAECLSTQNASEVTLCTCTSSDTTPANDFPISRACVPTVASTNQQRIFWTLSMLVFGVGLVLSMVVINELLRNPLFLPSRPGGSMWSFAAIAVPDFVLSAVYFVFPFINLIRGVEMSPDPCEAFAVLTTMAVYATFLGPPIVAIASLRCVMNVIHGQFNATTPKVVVAVVLGSPWVLGLIIGLVARADGKSGSYRGLICYNTKWDSFSTGGLTVAMFGACTVTTAVSYITIAVLVHTSMTRVSITPSSGLEVRSSFSRAAGVVVQSFRRAGAGTTSPQGGQYHTDVLKRGSLLVQVFFLSWAFFVVVAGLNMALRPVSLTAEMLAALVISLQPILDAIVLLQTPSVRKAMVCRIFGELLAAPIPANTATAPKVHVDRSSGMQSDGSPIKSSSPKPDFVVRHLSSLPSLAACNSSDETI